MIARLCTVAAVLMVAATSWAQQQPEGEAGAPRPPAEGEPPRVKPLMDNFFAPELVMRYQKAIGLTPDQQTAIRAEMQKMLAQFTDLRWQQSAEEEAMEVLLTQKTLDEKQVLVQLDKLLSVENAIKRAHLASLVRIRNALTLEQQAKLAELKKQMEPRDRGDPPGPGREQDASGPRHDRPRDQDGERPVQGGEGRPAEKRE